MKVKAANERIKREDFRYLKEAHGRHQATIDAVARSLAQFEEGANGKDFTGFKESRPWLSK